MQLRHLSQHTIFNGLKIRNMAFQFYSTPNFTWQTPAWHLSKYFSKQLTKFELKLLNANLKGAENIKPIRFWNLPSIAGVQIKNGVFQYMVKQHRHRFFHKLFWFQIIRVAQRILHIKHCSMEMALCLGFSHCKALRTAMRKSCIKVFIIVTSIIKVVWLH